MARDILTARELFSMPVAQIALVETTERDFDVGVLWHCPQNDNIRSMVIRSAYLESEQATLDIVATAVQAPYYYGRNWDALNEVLADLEWIRSHHVVIGVTNVDFILQRRFHWAQHLLHSLYRAVAELQEEYEAASTPNAKRLRVALHTSDISAIPPDIYEENLASACRFTSITLAT